MKMMRGLVVVAVVLSGAGCTKRNPDVCCSSAPECAEIGFDDITPCEDLRVCVNSMCVDPQCSTSAECSAPTPYCVGQICAASCTADPDCNGVAGASHCAPDGTCVACLASDQCSDPNTPVCDDNSHACRACTADAECASGICLAAEGICAAETDVVYVATGGADSGDCPATSPCRTIAYGLTKVTAQRRVLRLIDSDFAIPDGEVIDRSVYIDAPGTRLTRVSAGPIFSVDGAASVTIEAIRVEDPGSVPVITVIGQSSLVLTDVDLDAIVFGTAVVTVDDAALRITRSHIAGASAGNGVGCTGLATLELDDSVLELATSAISGDFCLATVHHNRFARTKAIFLTRSQLVMENNLIDAVGSGATETNVSLNQARAGTSIRFNTFVSENPGSGAAINCSGLADSGIVSSNIFAWQSASPVTAATTCGIGNCLYDSNATATPGTSNVTGVSFSTIFVDPGNGDFHTSSTSPAIQAAEEGLDVSDDLEHSPRPAPTGSAPDIGAYELP
jgi:hypothetical protein